MIKKYYIDTDEKSELMDKIMDKIDELLTAKISSGKYNPYYNITISSVDSSEEVCIKITKSQNYCNYEYGNYFIYVYSHDNNIGKTCLVSVYEYSKCAIKTILFNIGLLIGSCVLKNCINIMHGVNIREYDENTIEYYQLNFNEDSEVLKTEETLIKYIKDTIYNFVTPKTPTVHIDFKFKINEGRNDSKTIESTVIGITIQKLVSEFNNNDIKDTDRFLIYGILPSLHYDNGRELISNVVIFSDLDIALKNKYLYHVFKLKECLRYNEHLDCHVEYIPYNQFTIND